MEILSVAWWLWMLLGIALLAAELLTPGGFYIIFFGAAGLAVGLLKLCGLVDSTAVEGLLFAVLAVAGLAFFRKPLMQRFKHLSSPQKEVDSLTSEIAVALADIPARSIGKVELRGAVWSAQNISEIVIPKSARCRVDSVDGLTLNVRSL
ncbi:MAG: NfeD family protein [Acidobacteria bacterium]|nr:NfeD family protein [Acidobacteriota bacterium]